jgi:hypothetical protein
MLRWKLRLDECEQALPSKKYAIVPPQRDGKTPASVGGRNPLLMPLLELSPSRDPASATPMAPRVLTWDKTMKGAGQFGQRCA